MGGCGNNNNPVKVVIINTQYVETDAVSFKSVVQRLTGKDAVVAAAAAEEQEQRGPVGPALGRGMSFKDLDRMLKDMPSLDELYTLLS